MHRHPMQRRLVTGRVARVTHVGALDSFVVVRRVFPAFPSAVIVPFDPVTTATAATGADQPEEARGEGEGYGEPDPDVDGAANIGVDLVLLERGVESADEGGVEDRGCEGEAHEEEGADAADDGGGDAAEAREERGKADEDFDNGGDNSDDVADEHPFGDGFVRV